MPLYEYQCETCRKRTEKIQSFSAPPLTTCEHCGGHLERLISAPAIQFKGSGWYVTDYAKSGASASAAPAKDAKPEAAKADGGGEGAAKETAAKETPAAKTEK